MMKRISLIFRAKANKALDKAEDPRETLDYSYERQLELLQKVRRGVADVATSRKRLELQLNQLQTSSPRSSRARPRQALAAGPRGPRPRGADPQVRAPAADQPTSQAQHAQLQGEEEKLTLASQRLQAKVDAFRTRKETIKATYTAAEAQTKIDEAFSGISEEMGDVGMAIQRAEDKTAQMQARAGADRRADRLRRARRRQLDQPGTTSRASWSAMSSQADVEAELAALKGSSPAAHRRRREDTHGRRRRRRQARSCQTASRRSSHDRPDPGRGPVERRRRPARRAQRPRRGLEAAVEAGDEEAFAAALAAPARQRARSWAARSPTTRSTPPT